MIIDVRKIIELAGGTEAIVQASAHSRLPLTEYAVLKWRTRCIPESRWELLLTLANARGWAITHRDLEHANAAITHRVIIARPKRRRQSIRDKRLGVLAAAAGGDGQNRGGRRRAQA